MSFNKTKIANAIAYSFLFALPATFAAQAQTTASDQEGVDDAIETIVVTADLAQRDLSELPAAALVVDETIINSRHARHLQDLVAVVPNVNFSAGASRGRFIQIRGIGERSQFSEPINPSIGLLLDDVDISGIGGLATVYDLAQVEVLSGPQSVATGLNSLGGIVKLVSNAPTSERYANVSLSYAQYNESRLAATYSNSLSENLDARFSIQQTKSDGFIENAFLNREDTNGTDELTATAKFNYAIGEASEVDLNLYLFDIDNGYDAFALDNSNITLSDNPGFDRVEGNAASVKFSHLFDQHKLQVSAFQLNADTDYGYDGDWVFVGFHPDEFPAFDRYTREITRNGIDLKLANISTQDENQYLVGVNIANHDEDLLRRSDYIGADYRAEYKPSSQSVYGQYIASVNDEINITAAARVENFDADYEDNDGFIADIGDTLFAASVAIDYSVSDNLLFASISRGYKAGGFNIDQRLEVEDRSFTPEYNINYEMGIKGRAFDGVANINLTFFYMDRKDAQVSDAALFIDEESGAPDFADVIGNADNGVNKGAELASTWDISNEWYLQANLGYLDATFGDYEKFDGSFVPLQQQAQAPEFTGYFASNWQINSNLQWFVDLDVKDDYRFSDGHLERAPFTAVANTELTWQSSGEHLYSVKLWVKNIFDRTTFTRGFSFGNDPRNGYENTQPYYQFGQERQVGVSFTYEWD